MRVAILTLPLHTNFGGILQAYALQTVLERIGNDVCVLEISRPAVSKWSRCAIFVKRLIKFIIRKETAFYGSRTEWEIVNSNTQRFICNYIHQKSISNLMSLHEGDFDAVVVGSDQIWRTEYYQPISNAYLAFAKGWKNIKRIAYAPSFGTDDWKYSSQETHECSSLLKMFDAVSVRESSGVSLCKEYFGVDAVQMLDPVLLLEKEVYLALAYSVTRKHGHYMLSCFLDASEEKESIAKSLSCKYGLSLFRNNNPDTECYSLSFEKRIQSPVEEWIAGFRDAEFVITDSFHGCVFSILFNKPFAVILNEKRGNCRIHSLLDMFGLEWCIIENRQFMNHSIDWKRINDIINKGRQNAMEFLSIINVN